MSTKQIFSIGTHVFYQGDDINQEGYGKITDHLDDYLGDLVMEITLEDGRVLPDVTPGDFEARTILGNTRSAEFKMLDGWEEEVAAWSELEAEELGTNKKIAL
jgi:hypothetical protein